MKKNRTGFLPSSFLPVISVKTDGILKDRHNREIMFVLGLLRDAGITRYNLHHINDCNLTNSLPIKKGNKFYDISYVSSDNEIILLEVMRIYKKYTE